MWRISSYERDRKSKTKNETEPNAMQRRRVSTRGITLKLLRVLKCSIIDVHGKRRTSSGRDDEENNNERRGGGSLKIILFRSPFFTLTGASSTI